MDNFEKRKLQQCQNIARQYKPRIEENLEYGVGESPLLAKLIGDISHNVFAEGSFFAQQYMLQKELRLFGPKWMMAAID